MPKNGEGAKSVLDSEKKLQKQGELATSENLPKNVCMKLYDLMEKVVDSDVNPKTVNAACSCAAEIYKILKLNHEMTK